MAEIGSNELQAIVEKVVQRLGGSSSASSGGSASSTSGSPDVRSSGRGVFPDIDSAVSAARQAFQVYSTVPLETRKRMIANVRRRTTEYVDLMSRLAVEETGLGRVSDKVIKNLLVINKTPGPEILEPKLFTGDNGITMTEHAPYGTFGVITPCTNPTETVINNGIGMLSAGNTAVFNFHPSAKRVSALCISIVNDAIVEAGGPENTLTAVAEPTIASAQALMKHPQVRLLCVTGGPAVVKVAMGSGKKAIAAGPGNPPVVVDETADIAAANVTNKAAHWKMAVPLVFALFIGLIVVLPGASWHTVPETQSQSMVAPIGNALLQEYLLPFEVISVLLLGALLGAVVLVRREVR